MFPEAKKSNWSDSARMLATLLYVYYLLLTHTTDVVKFLMTVVFKSPNKVENHQECGGLSKL